MDSLVSIEKRGYTYLASPYSHPDGEVRERRFKEICEIAGYLMNVHKMILFVPIAMTHPISVFCGLPKAWDYWKQFDAALVLGASRVLVAMMDGWRESVGVQAEMEMARQAGIPVHYLDLITMEVREKV